MRQRAISYGELAVLQGRAECELNLTDMDEEEKNEAISQYVSDHTMEVEAADVDWVAYREDVKQSLQNERLWAMCDTQHEENVLRYEKEIRYIDQGRYDEVLEMYDRDIDVFAEFTL